VKDGLMGLDFQAGSLAKKDGQRVKFVMEGCTRIPNSNS
jgi:hypothetical protein